MDQVPMRVGRGRRDTRLIALPVGRHEILTWDEFDDYPMEDMQDGGSILG